MSGEDQIDAVCCAAAAFGLIGRVREQDRKVAPFQRGQAKLRSPFLQIIDAGDTKPGAQTFVQDICVGEVLQVAAERDRVAPFVNAYHVVVIPRNRIDAEWRGQL